MTIELITKRTCQKEFDTMVEIWNFCTARFGKPDYFKTWDASFADSTDDWVAFTFWDEALAVYVKLVYPGLMTRNDFDFRDYT